LVARPDTTKQPTGLALYTTAATAASREVIRSYSTSFGVASNLLGSRVRSHVQNIYALVRVADEIVDGAAAEAASISREISPRIELDEFEAETYRAMRVGYSTNLVIHAFATTAQTVGIGEDLVRPFFESMQLDLWQKKHDEESFERYVYGSAEVVGLMCLKAFVKGRKYTEAQSEQLVSSGRALGAAFQKVNFLRDLSADFRQLGRSYLPGVKISKFDEEQKAYWVDNIRSDIRVAGVGLKLLPLSSRIAVTAALSLFNELNEKISATPANQVINQRISVSTPRKLWLVVRAPFGVKLR
jgi:phytoene synthase